MRAVYLLGAAALQLGAAAAMKLELNRELSVSFAHKGIAFAASREEVPFDLLMVDSKDVSSNTTAAQNSTNEGDGESEVDSNPLSLTFEQRSCVVDDSTYSSTSVHIHVLISSSLSYDECGKIAQWSANLFDVAATSSYKDIVLSFVIVPSSTYRTDEDDENDEDTTYDAYSLLAQDEGEDDGEDDDTYALLRNIGTVYDKLDDLELTGSTCDAVFSFVDDDTSLQTVLTYEDGRRVDSAINFRVCSSGSCCTEQTDYCTAIHRVDDAFLYNPMTITREMSCAGVLKNGVPVIYVDGYGSRSCYCACPAGYEEDETNGCVEVNPPPCKCEWNKRSGYRKEICSLPTPPIFGEPIDVCTFSSIATSWKVPVPFPTDGYVADARENGDVNKGAPRVEVTVTKLHNPVYNYEDVIAAVKDGKLPYQAPEAYPPLTPYRAADNSETESDKNYSWHYYHSNRDDVIDSLGFHGYGKYQLELDAYDYYGSASCPGCISIVDSIRPRTTHTCPAGVGDEQPETSTGSGSKCANSAALTKDNLEEVNENIEDYFEFSKDVTNDACNEITERCDIQSFKVRKFYDSDYCDESESYESAGQVCFDEQVVVEDYLTNSKSKENPLTKPDGTCHGEDQPVTPDQCTRCCDYHTEIREWWIDYKCGYDYDTKRCSGTGSDHEKCAHHQCLVLDGEHVATGSVSIRDDIRNATEAVLAALGNSAYGLNSIVEIHDSLECSNYGDTESGRCTYEKKLTELFNVSLSFNTAEFDWEAKYNVQDYVFWRYTIPNKKEGWKSWNPFPVGSDLQETIVFSRPKTTITIEAWTQCGRVLTFTASVHLHLHSVISVCDHYDKMWYQTTAATKFDNSTICAYPGSDFAELTFDFHSSTGLENTPERAGLSLSQVECYGMIDDTGGALLFSVPGGDIVSRFGVEMVYQTQTEASTSFQVDCTFSYSGPNGYSTSATCTKTVLIQDCKAPCFDTHADHCQYTECAGSAQPGLYEACGGAIVSSNGYDTLLTTEGSECCQGCASDDMEVSCVPLLNLPDASQDLMRCQPFPKSYGDSTSHGQHGNHHHNDNNDDEGSTDSDTESVVYANPYSNSETTTSTDSGAYAFLANTFPNFKSTGLFGKQSTASNTAYSGTEGTATTTTSGGTYGGQGTVSTGTSTTNDGAYDSQSTTTTTGGYGAANGDTKSSGGGVVGKVSGIVRDTLDTIGNTVNNVKDKVKDNGGTYKSSGGNAGGGNTGGDNVAATASTNSYGNQASAPASGGDYSSQTTVSGGTSTSANTYDNQGGAGNSFDTVNGKVKTSSDGYSTSDRNNNGNYGGDSTGNSNIPTSYGAATSTSTTPTSDNTSQAYTTSSTSSTNSAYSMLAAASSVAHEYPQVMVLLGSSAFIAVIALVVVKRRADALHLERMENDVYYPLLH